MEAIKTKEEGGLSPMVDDVQAQTEAAPVSERVLEARKLFIEADNLDNEIKAGGLVNIEATKVLQEISTIKRELAEYLARVEVLEHDQTILGTKSDEDIKKRVQNAYELQSLPNYIADLRKQLKTAEEKLANKNWNDEENIESSEKIWGETAPKDMLYEEALAWVAELSKRDGVEYKIPTIEELEHAHKNEIKGFDMDKVYLSSSEDDFLKGNHLGFNFGKGARESKARGSYFAIRVNRN